MTLPLTATEVIEPREHELPTQDGEYVRSLAAWFEALANGDEPDLPENSDPRYHAIGLFRVAHRLSPAPPPPRVTEKW